MKFLADWLKIKKLEPNVKFSWFKVSIILLAALNFVAALAVEVMHLRKLMKKSFLFIKP